MGDGRWVTDVNNHLSLLHNECHPGDDFLMSPDKTGDKMEMH